jgi:hypothetical protein
MISSRATQGNAAGRPARIARTPRPDSTEPITRPPMPWRAQARRRCETSGAATVTSNAPEPISPSGSME